MTKFKVGDRVAYYSGKFGRKTGTVNQFMGTYVLVLGDDEGHYTAHPKQCRKLKPRAKRVRFTRKDLATAWDRLANCDNSYSVSSNSLMFYHIVEALGLDNET